jgi:4'-phosphopantetheinyl transferase
MKFQVGVDLEKVGKPRPFLKLSERFFSPLECKWIAQGVGSPAQELRFLKTWTAKEAVIKAKGGGVFKDLSRIRVKAGRAGSIQILSHPFSHYALKCPRGYVGAVCLK